MNELGLYIHIPFCAKKCYYCDFISYAHKQEKIEAYCNALIKEIQQESKNIKNEDVVTTIYIGGGTPSFVDTNYITKIIETIKNNYKKIKNYKGFLIKYEIAIEIKTTVWYNIVNFY